MWISTGDTHPSVSIDDQLTIKTTSSKSPTAITTSHPFPVADRDLKKAMLRLQLQTLAPPTVPDLPSSSPSCSDQIPCCHAHSSPSPLKSRRQVALRSSDHHWRRWRSGRETPHPRPCKSSLGVGGVDDSDQFLEASLLIPETLRHYSFWKQGFVEETKWNSLGQKYVLPHQGKREEANISPIGFGFLRRFQSPTVFLKITCDGDLLLPVTVGELDMDELVDALKDDKHEECPDQYQVIKNIVGRLGYEVKMVQVTERVMNTYYAHIILGKYAEGTYTRVDARPSDALNVAIRLKVPIYISKGIVLKDAIKLVYGRWRRSGVKTVYDVSLDSAEEGPDPLGEELSLVQRINLAVQEERYKDAAIWRDKLTKLRDPKHDI